MAGSGCGPGPSTGPTAPRRPRPPCRCTFFGRPRCCRTSLSRERKARLRRSTTSLVRLRTKQSPSQDQMEQAPAVSSRPVDVVQVYQTTTCSPFMKPMPRCARGGFDSLSQSGDPIAEALPLGRGGMASTGDTSTQGLPPQLSDRTARWRATSTRCSARGQYSGRSLS